MLRVEVLVDVLVQFLVRPRRLGCVEVAATCDMAVGRVEVERRGDGVKVLHREILEMQVFSKDATGNQGAGFRTLMVAGCAGLAARIAVCVPTQMLPAMALRHDNEAICLREEYSLGAIAEPVRGDALEAT